MRKKLCIYCGQNPGTTRDHIPPRGFFEKPCPNIKRITVPCCEACRLADEANDEKARNLIISTAPAEPHRVVQSQLADARNRAIDDHGQLPVLLEHMVPADISTSAGVYLGSSPAFNLNNPVMDAFLHRMARGLLHSVKNTGFVPSKVQWQTNLQPDIFAIFASGLSGSFGDVFSYRALFVEDSHDSLWLLTFFERLHFKVSLHSTVTQAQGTRDD